MAHGGVDVSGEEAFLGGDGDAPGGVLQGVVAGAEAFLGFLADRDVAEEEAEVGASAEGQAASGDFGGEGGAVGAAADGLDEDEAVVFERAGDGLEEGGVGTDAAKPVQDVRLAERRARGEEELLGAGVGPDDAAGHVGEEKGVVDALEKGLEVLPAQGSDHGLGQADGDGGRGGARRRGGGGRGRREGPGSAAGGVATGELLELFQHAGGDVDPHRGLGLLDFVFVAHGGATVAQRGRGRNRKSRRGAVFLAASMPRLPRRFPGWPEGPGTQSVPEPQEIPRFSNDS